MDFVGFQSAVVGRFFSARRRGLAAVALLKGGVQARAFVQVAAAISVALLCTLGVTGNAQAQGAFIFSVSPNTGVPGGGTTVIINGRSLDTATVVDFGANPGTIVSDTPGQITAISPVGTGTVSVTVITTLNGSATDANAFTYAAVGSTTSLTSSPNPSSTGQAVRFTATVTGASPTGTVTFFDGGTQIGTATLSGGTATFTTSLLTTGSHSITARYGGDVNNNASASGAVLQSVNVSPGSIGVRQMQVSATPIIAQISGQAISGAIDSAIDAGFSSNPPLVTPNGGGFTVQIPLDQPPETTIPRFTTLPPGGGGASTTGFALGGSRRNGPGSLANGGQGGNGAPPGTRLIDMAIMPLPPGSGMPPLGETRFSPTEVAMQFSAGTTAQQIAAIAQRFGLTLEGQQAIGVLRRSVYTFRIPNGQTVRQVIGAVEGARLNLAVQPVYAFALTQNAPDQNSGDQQPGDPQSGDQQAGDQNNPSADAGDPAQYIISKFRLPDAHRITNGDKVVIAVIDSEIDFKQPNLAGAIADRYDAGCGASAPDPHGTGMAGAIVSHGQLMGVAPRATIIAICAFGGTGHPNADTVKIINGLDYAIQHGARIVNMSFAGPRDPALSQALQIAREKGVLLIAAAGNAGPKSPPLYPGADPSVMAVTATDEHDRVFNGANQGSYVTVAAPGVNVLVPAPEGGIQFTTGTSVATANVSGVAALLIAHKPSLTPEEIRALLVRTAKHLGPRGMNPEYGAGLVDPVKALETGVSQASAPQRYAQQNPVQAAPQVAPAPAQQTAQQDDLNSFLASPDGNKRRVADGFSALGYVGDGGAWSKAPPPAVDDPSVARLGRRARRRFRSHHGRQRYEGCAGQHAGRHHAPGYAGLFGRRARRLRAFRLQFAGFQWRAAGRWLDHRRLSGLANPAQRALRCRRCLVGHLC